jgi:glycosyltransferase involved in cell wall biosynthesis
LFGLFSSAKIGTLPVITIPNQSQLYRFFFWRFKKKMEQRVLDLLFKKNQPSAVHLHVVYGFAEEAMYLQTKYQLPFLISEHMGPFPFEWITEKEALIIRPIQQAAQVAAVSKAQAAQITNFTGVVPTIIPNVVNEHEFYFSPVSRHRAAKVPLQLVFTGVYTKAKGGDYLLRVFPKFLKSYPDAVLHLVGGATSERMEELKNIVRESGVEKNVQFHGNLSAVQLNKLYQQCDLYVCSSEWESFGLSVLEALFTGLPALCTQCGGVSDFIHDENGMLIRNDQQSATLLNGLLQIVACLQQYNREQIAKQVRTRFSGSRIQEGYLQLYRQMIHPSSAA